MRKRSALVIAMVVGAFAMLGVQSAAADTIEVANTDNSGAGSLRAAINQANQLAGPDRIAIEATGTIPLQSGLPTVTGTPLVIQGPGASDLSLDGSAVSGAALALDPVIAPNVANRTGVLRSTLRGNRTGISNGDNPLNVTESSLIGNHRYGIDDAFGGAVIEDSTMAAPSARQLRRSDEDLRAAEDKPGDRRGHGVRELN